MKKILVLCIDALIIVVSWFLVGTIIGHDPTSSIKLLLSGDGTIIDVLGVCLFIVVTSVFIYCFRKNFFKQ